MVEAVKKIVGDKVGIEFDSSLPHQGQYDAARKIITLAATTNFSASNAFHEAFHAIDTMLSSEQRRTVYKAFREGSVRAQLRELLAHAPDAWEAARNDPRELLAYGFQFWHAGVLKVGPHVETFFGKLVDMWQRANAWLRAQPTAEQMLRQIADGQFAEGKVSPVEEALSRNAKIAKRVQEFTAPTFKFVDKLYDRYLYPFDRRVRDFGNPHLDALAKQLYTQVGEKAGQRGLVQVMPVEMKARINALDKVMRLPDFKETLEQMAAGEKPDTDAAKAIRGWLDAQHDYMKQAGVDIGYVENYIPMSWDGDKIAANKEAFTEMLRAHADELKEINADLTPEKVADMMASRNKATSEFHGAVYDERGAPNADFTLNRVFGFLGNAERRPFVRDDIAGGLMRYAKQAVRRAEWARRFGEDGAKWDDSLKKAEEFGLTDEERKLMASYKDAIFGARLYDMNPTLRKVLAATTVYQNYRVLGLSLLSNIIDPFGVAVRSGEWKEAMNAYKLAIGRVTKSGREKTADLQALAETIGVIESTSAADAVASMYGGVNIEGSLRKANNTLFRLNGMDGLNRSVRLAALAAAVNFVKKHAEGDPRHLAELGLKPEDVHVDGDGRLKILEQDGLTPEQSTKVQAALNRFVDEAALRPNAGERTEWGANPYLAPIYHLKQFMFSFNHVINKKLEHEMFEHGNSTPYVMAAAYVPIMAMSGLIRDAVYHAGNLPAQNGMMHYLWSGFVRSGLAGPSDLAELAVGGVAKGDINSIKQVLGPTAEQAMDVVGAIAAPSGSGRFGHFVNESLPLGSILEHYR